MQHDMEKEVAQFLPEVGVVVAVDGLEQLADLLHEAITDGAVGLLAIPGATIGGAESGGGREKEV
jgi:hypothetical protein